MRRLQTKCMFVSAVVHSLLLVALFVGSAFLPAKPKTISLANFKPFTVVTDAETAGGGNPDAVKPVVEQLAPPPAAIEKPATVIQQPPPAVVQPPPPVVEKKQETLKPPVDKPVKPVHKETPPPKVTKAPVNQKQELLKPTPEVKKQNKPVVDITSIKRVDVDREREREQRQMETRKRVQEAARVERERQQKAYEQAVADANEKAQKQAREAADAVNGITSTLASRTSRSTPIEMPQGPGGIAYVNYTQAIWTIYNNAWVMPPERSSEATVRVEILVARDGRVIRATVLSKSGDAALDKSVQTTLDRVKSLPAFPESTTDQTRSFKINFNLKAKRNFG